MKTGVWCTSFAFLVLAIPTIVSAATRHVPANYATIQDAVNAAASGDSILLAPGTYTGPGNHDVLVVGKSLTFASELTADSTIIDCEWLGRGFEIRSAPDPGVAFYDITIMHGSGGDPPSMETAATALREGGGGLFCRGSHLALKRMIFRNNRAWAGGGAVYADSSSVDVRNCTVETNEVFLEDFGNVVGGGICVRDGRLLLRGSTIEDNNCLDCNGGGIYADSLFDVRDNIIRGNYLDTGIGGGLRGSIGTLDGNTIESNTALWGAGASVGRCDSVINNVFLDNSNHLNVGGGGGGYEGSATFVSHNRFQGNLAAEGAAMRLYNADAELRENVFIDNYGDITSVVEGGGSMESCTIVNASGYYSSRPISMSGSIVRCIIVVTTPYAEAIFAGTPTVSCTDIYAPPATIDPGSYVDGGGNIAVDPLFCDAAGGDYHLFSASPCLYQPCGPMGAFGRGCWSEQPAVAGVTDVGNDQGRQARIAWARSLYDAGADSVVITGYGIYRRQDAYAAGKTELPPETLERREAGTSIAGWDYIATVPARGDSVYQTVVPTLCDSTIAGGMCWSVFFVSAMTPDPLVFFDSAPDSGYSLDNLPPSVPQNLVVAYNTGSGNKLEWHPNGDADLLCYRVYRSTDPNFTPEPGSHVHVAWTPVWVDSVSEGYQYHYAVTAVDVAGNESDAATPGSVTAAPREPTVPVRWALYDAVPNPFNPETTIRYDVPSGSGMVTLRIYDVRGALVRTLVDGRRPEGTHAIGWNGRDGRGRRVASGVYFCRMVSGRFAATRRVVLLK